MGSAIKKLSSCQIGKEGSRGGGADASRIIVADGRWTRLEDFEEFEDENRGNLARTSRAPELVRNGMLLELREKLAFNQVLMMALLSGVKGGVTGTGAEADKTWTFAPGMAADPAPDTYLAEFVEKSPADEAEMESAYVFCTGWEITTGVDGIPQIVARFVGRKVVDGTKTAALSLPSLQSAGALRFGHYLDDDWASLGTTQIQQQIYNFTHRFGGGGPGNAFIFPQYYQDARADQDFSGYEYADRVVDVEFDVVHDPAAAKFVQTEEAKKSAGTLRFLQSRLVGPSLGGSTYKVQMDGAFYHAADSMTERGNDRDGQLMTHVHLKSAEDPTANQDASYVVVNDMAAFP